MPALTALVHCPDGLVTSRHCSMPQTLLLQQVCCAHRVLAAAADIRLEADIHSALHCNYNGTKAVLQLACGCKQLKALVHTSSCFVNMNLPCSSVVHERLYPLSFGTREVDCEELVQVRCVHASTLLCLLVFVHLRLRACPVAT